MLSARLYVGDGAPSSAKGGPTALSARSPLIGRAAARGVGAPSTLPTSSGTSASMLAPLRRRAVVYCRDALQGPSARRPR